ncbi:MAG: 4-(cytidine 5'-diphospho)-2-C-methyl-D-erythritol kinase [Phycisphaerae bacterium]|nr:4-(cytidine 5'-diphospho)-2-C-methyl-D-erythritol kinase [Phycisphaerae bacterium]
MTRRSEFRPNYVALPAPAKLNISLAIGPRQPDGYHLLDSLMVPLDLHDDVRLSSSAGGIELAVSGPTGASTPADPTNLVWRAAELLAQEAGRPSDVRIELFKRIPVAGGLGGGSSDAGATLVGLNRLWNLNFPVSRLAGLGSRLGSDVPFCVYRHPSWVRGRGEIVEPLQTPIPSLFIVLIFPGIAIATRNVYEHLDVSMERLLRIIPRKHPFRGVVFFNDLEGPALEVCPPLSRLFRTLEKSAGVPRLMVAGSGSTLFAAFDNPTDASQCEHRVRSCVSCGTAVAAVLPGPPEDIHDEGDCDGHQRGPDQTGGPPQ